MKSKKFWWFVLAVVVFLLEYEAFDRGVLWLFNQPDDLLNGVGIVLAFIATGTIIACGAFFARKIFGTQTQAINQETKQNEK